MNRFVRVVALSTVVVLISSCGGSDSSGRTRNTALPSSSRLPYSCAQLKTETASESTTEIRFTLCDDAETYSIVVPEGVSGAMNDVAVQGGAEIAVPVSSEVNGPSTRLMVRTKSAVSDDITFHSGLHIYNVSIGSADENIVGANSPLLGSLYPKVAYDMPTPQPRSIYTSYLYSPGAEREQYASYANELLQKWAMVKLTTCHLNLAHASIANAIISSSVFGEMQILAKRFRDLDWFISINTIRNFVASADQQANICATNTNSFNIFTNGIEVGFSPLSKEKIQESTNIVELAKSYALLDYWAQIANGSCSTTEQLSVSQSVDELSEWANVALARLATLSTSEALEASQRTAAARLIQQIDVLKMLHQFRRAFDGVSQCTVTDAGYRVPVQQNVEETIELVSGTLAPEPVPNSSSPSSELSDSEISWPAATSTPSKVRAGQTISKAQLTALANMSTSSKSTVKLALVASSKKICKTNSWGIKTLKVGTCKVRISVATKGKKTLSKTLTIKVVK